MIEIAICICTKNRIQGLGKLLESLKQMTIPKDVKIQAIIVENNLFPYSEKIVKEFSSECKFKINYFLETCPGVASARNRAVKEANGSEFCCFVDDDQIVDADWLVELVKCQREFNADGVWGPNPPIFVNRVPSYIKHFHAPKFLNYGTTVTWAATCGLLLRTQFLDKIDGPFNLKLNYTGGEDVFLTSQISKLGGIIYYTPFAMAFEIVPKERATIKYIAKRSFRNSNIAYFVDSLENRNFNRYYTFFRLTMRLCLGMLIFFPFIFFGKANALKGLIKISDACGGFAFILGKQNQFYK